MVRDHVVELARYTDPLVQHGSPGVCFPLFGEFGVLVGQRCFGESSKPYKIADEPRRGDEHRDQNE